MQIHVRNLFPIYVISVVEIHYIILNPNPRS
jgi:hypothetical protein